MHSWTDDFGHIIFFLFSSACMWNQMATNVEQNKTKNVYFQISELYTALEIGVFHYEWIFFQRCDQIRLSRLNNRQRSKIYSATIDMLIIALLKT